MKNRQSFDPIELDERNIRSILKKGEGNYPSTDKYNFDENINYEQSKKFKKAFQTRFLIHKKISKSLKGRFKKSSEKNPKKEDYENILKEFNLKNKNSCQQVSPNFNHNFIDDGSITDVYDTYPGELYDNTLTNCNRSCNSEKTVNLKKSNSFSSTWNKVAKSLHKIRNRLNSNDSDSKLKNKFSYSDENLHHDFEDEEFSIKLNNKERQNFKNEFENLEGLDSVFQGADANVFPESQYINYYDMQMEANWKKDSTKSTPRSNSKGYSRYLPCRYLKLNPANRKNYNQTDHDDFLNLHYKDDLNEIMEKNSNNRRNCERTTNWFRIKLHIHKNRLALIFLFLLILSTIDGGIFVSANGEYQ